MFELTQVHCRIKNIELLHNISLAFKPGQINAIIGANGAGKSSLIKCLLGELPTSKGSLNFDGKALNDYSLAKLSKTRAYIAQGTISAFSISVFDYLVLARVQYEESEKYAENLIFEAAKQFSIVDFLLKDLSQLSGGERQNIEFVRAYLQLYECDSMQGKCLLLDEPASALDINQTQRLYAHISAFQAAGGTVIIIDHDVNAVANLCDYLVLIRHAKVFDHGPASQVFTKHNLDQCFNANGEFTQPVTGSVGTYHILAQHYAAPKSKTHKTLETTTF